jgi:hypothetical protein
MVEDDDDGDDDDDLDAFGLEDKKVNGQGRGPGRRESSRRARWRYYKTRWRGWKLAWMKARRS